MPDPLLIAKDTLGEQALCLLPALANRHGLIAGATGTGKTVTLQRIAESLSRIGVPVFMADVKGDLSGLSQAGAMNPKMKERAEKLGLGRDVLLQVSKLLLKTDPFVRREGTLHRSVTRGGFSPSPTLTDICSGASNDAAGWHGAGATMAWGR